MAGKLGEEIGIIGESLNLEPSAVGINAEELSTIGREGDLLDAIGLDEAEEIRIPDGTGSTATALDDGEVVSSVGDDGGLEGGGGGHVHVHGHEAAAAAGAAIGTGVEAGGGLEGDGIAEEVGGGQNEDGGGGELHCCIIGLFDRWNWNYASCMFDRLTIVAMRWVGLEN